MSGRRIVSEGDARVVVQEGVYSGPSSFTDFDDENATFVDKSLAIEAFLRDRGGHHLVLEYTLDDSVEFISDQISAFTHTDAEPFKDFLQRPPKSDPSTDITTSQFAGMAITDHGKLVSKHFRRYPVLYIDLKVNWLVSTSKGVILIGPRMFVEPHTKKC